MPMGAQPCSPQRQQRGSEIWGLGSLLWPRRLRGMCATPPCSALGDALGLRLRRLRRSAESSLSLSPSHLHPTHLPRNKIWMNEQAEVRFRPISTLPSNIPYTPSNQELKVCLWQWTVQQRCSKGLSQASSRARDSPTHRGLNSHSSNSWMRLPYVCLGCQSFQSEATNIFLAKTHNRLVK